MAFFRRRTSFHLALAALLALGCFLGETAFSQEDQRAAPTGRQIGSPLADAQSTSGPVPPRGVSPGLPPGTLDYEVVISDVPAYLWYNGCGPTAAGMVIGYWAEQGFNSLVGGDASSQTQAVNDMISSSGNYDDYCLPIDYSPNLLPDLSEPPPGDEHDDNCVADFMRTSQSHHLNYYGWSWFSDVPGALEDYSRWSDDHYQPTARNITWFQLTWNTVCTEIDANRPLVFLVDSDANGFTDHFVTVIGYGEQSGTSMYACYDTWDLAIHWYEFERIQTGQPFGIYGATTFDLKKVKGLTADNHELRASAGGTINFDLDGGLPYGLTDYVLLATASGPGSTPLPGGNSLPITRDAVMNYIWHHHGTDPMFVDFSGVLDSSGQADATLAVTGPMDPLQAGTVLHFCWTSMNPWGFQSNLVQVDIVP